MPVRSNPARSLSQNRTETGLRNRLYREPRDQMPGRCETYTPKRRREYRKTGVKEPTHLAYSYRDAGMLPTTCARTVGLVRHAMRKQNAFSELWNGWMMSRREGMPPSQDLAQVKMQ